MSSTRCISPVILLSWFCAVFVDCSGSIVLSHGGVPILILQDKNSWRPWGLPEYHMPAYTKECPLKKIL